jgi:secreted trypsin-like serine protease
MTNLECSIRTRILESFENNLANVAIIYPGHLCTFARRGVGLCFADSGSPLITRDGVVGVAVSGVLLCARGGPDIYVRVSTYSDWIDSYIHDFN